MQRWHRLGCWTIVMAPFAAPVGILVYIAFDRATDEAGLFAGLLVAAAIWLGGLLAATLFQFRQRAGRPDARAVGPRAGDELPVGDASRKDPGPVGPTRIEIVEWAPGGAIRLRQRRGWSPVVLIPPAAVVLTTVVAVPSFEAGRLTAGLPEETFWLVLGAWAFVGFSWAALPALPRTVAIDRRDGTVRTRYGRIRNVLGLGRVAGVTAFEKRFSGGGGDTGRHRPTSAVEQVLLWVRPDGGYPVPYLLVESGTQRLHEAGPYRQAVEELAADLAAALGVPARVPDHAANPAEAHV